MLDVISLIQGSIDDVSNVWIKFLSVSRHETTKLTMVKGIYYGRDFYVCHNNRGVIQLHIEPLMSHELISNLITMFTSI